MGSFAKKGLQQYLIQLQQHPLRTKMITAGTMSAISDIVAQKLTGIQKLQLRRLLLKVIFGAAYLGPLGHFFHIFLDKVFKGKKDTKTVAKKVVVEQLTWSPWSNLFFMIYYGFVVEGRPWIQVKSKIKKEYPTVQYTSWTFWPVVGWGNIFESASKVYATNERLMKLVMCYKNVYVVYEHLTRVAFFFIIFLPLSSLVFILNSWDQKFCNIASL